MKDILVSDTSVYISQEHYFTKLKAQLCKDFGEDDFDAAVENLTAVDADKLRFVVTQFLTHLEKQNTESFFQALYRIDIPDADFKNQILTNGLDLEGLSDLVIKRELIKILLREKYSEL